MSTNGFTEYDADSVAVRPLSELPMLRLAERAVDIRGWEVRGGDGRLLGTVADLLVDIDRLRADTLLVSLAGGERAGATVVVSLHGVAPAEGCDRRLVPGKGMPAIHLRYESTTRYAIWVAIVAIVMALAAWILGSFD